MPLRWNRFPKPSTGWRVTSRKRADPRQGSYIGDNSQGFMIEEERRTTWRRSEGGY
jgi:hypothetical protein